MSLCQTVVSSLGEDQDTENWGSTQSIKVGLTAGDLGQIRVIIYVLKMCLHLVEQRMMSVIRICLSPTGSVIVLQWTRVVHSPLIMLQTPALLCHKDTHQGTKSPLLGACLSLCLDGNDGIRAPIIYSFHAWKSLIIV